MAVWVVKTVDDDGYPIPGVFDQLQASRARIGWSYQDNLDLRLISQKINEGEPLNQDECEAKRCLRFYTEVAEDDFLIYPHQPQRRQFTVVQVTGKYGYSPAHDALDGDFRSFRPCQPRTPEPIDWYDEIVPSQLRIRLGRPGRFSKIYDTEPFFMFLRAVPEAGRHQDGSNRSSLQRIHDELRKVLPDMLRREFSSTDLSRRFCQELFEKMGYDPEVQEGPGEAGSDVVVTVNDPLLPDEEGAEIRIGVQVFAYEGKIEEQALRTKLDQLLRGWEANSLSYGTLLTTGRCSETARAALRGHNQNNPNRLVRLIEANDLADLFLQYFPPAAG